MQMTTKKQKINKKIVVVLSVLLAVCSPFSAIATSEFLKSYFELEQVKTYRAKMYDEYYTCTGKAYFSDSFLMGAGLSDCGKELFDSLSVRILPLSSIYRGACSDEYGETVYGCADIENKKIYICESGTSVRDRKMINRYEYEELSYTCGQNNSHDTLRHELLHFVYASLTNEEKSIANSILAKHGYTAEYKDDLSLYSSPERDEELFVRIGVDYHYMKDIELIDMYAKVVRGYAELKKEHYFELANEADQQYEEQNDIFTGKIRDFVIAVLPVLLAIIGILTIVL